MTAKTVGEKRNPRAPGRHSGVTVGDFARNLVAIELGGGCILDRVAFRTRGQVAPFALPYMRGATVADVEAGLELLVERDLVDIQTPEGRVSAERPQGYRWAKRATPERLEAFCR